MGLLKKTIFLTNNDKSKGMATLNLEFRNNNLFGNIKIYTSIPKGNYILGLKTKEKIIKQNINLQDSSYSFIISDNLDLSTTLSCVVLQVDGNNIEPILWGSEKDENYKGKIINTLRESVTRLTNSTNHKNQTRESISTTQHVSPLKENSNQYQQLDIEGQRRYENISTQPELDTIENVNNFANSKTQSLYEQDTKTQATEKIIVEYSPIHNQTEIQNQEYLQTNNNQYSENYSQISLDEELINNQNIDEIAVACNAAELFESDDKEIENIIDNNINNINIGKHKFYDMISDQLQELFQNYPKETNLCKLIDNSNWIKIDTGIDNKNHVIGIITHNNDIKYICYGVPSTYSTTPPTEMRGYCQWLPIDTQDPYNNGYWVMYQDADTGENILID